MTDTTPGTIQRMPTAYLLEKLSNLNLVASNLRTQEEHGDGTIWIDAPVLRELRFNLSALLSELDEWKAGT